MFGGEGPDGLAPRPPVLQTGLGVLGAEQLAGLEVEHVVAHHARGPRVEAGGEAGPHREVVGREHGHHLAEGGAVLLDPLEGLEPVPGHLGHVPPALGQVVPPQPG